MKPLQVALVTAGDPGQMTGGYLFHRRLADMASGYDARVTFVSVPAMPLAYALLSGPWWARSPGIQTADVVVLDSIAAASAAPWLGQIDAPIIGMLHQPPGGMGSRHLARRVRAPFDRWGYGHCLLLMVASDWLADQLVSGGMDRRRLRIVPPGKDPATAGSHAGSGRPEGQGIAHVRPATLRGGRRIAVLCVANWLASKGIVELLQALATLPDEAVTLHLVGDHDVDQAYARRVRALLATPDLRSRVVVHGIVAPADVAELYRSADLFALPSFEETYGTAWGEAMAAGLPIVGWRAGNLPFLADHEHEALLAPPGDVSMLADHIQRMASDSDARERMGRAAALRSQARPTWADTARQFFAIIEEVRVGAAGHARPASVADTMATPGS